MMTNSRMRAVVLAVSVAIAVSALAGVKAPNSGQLVGKTGFSSEWGSGWLNLAEATDFAKGAKLRLTIGGTARKVLVRILPKTQSPDSPDGIVGNAVSVPATRVIEVVLDSVQRNIIQISVHGNENPWGQFPLGAGNGPATLKAVEIVAR